MNDDDKEYQDAALFDLLPESIYIVDRDTCQLLYLNEAGRQLLGMKPEDDYRQQYCYALLRG